MKIPNMDIVISDSDKQWCVKLMATINLHGVWGVPRSGMIFQKFIPTGMKLISVMPFMDDMARAAQEGQDVPPTKEALLEYQRDDYETIKSRFVAAGFTISDPQNLLHIDTGSPEA